jgi:hypothetical protein
MKRLTSVICAIGLLLAMLIGTGTGATAATAPAHTSKPQLLSPTP